MLNAQANTLLSTAITRFGAPHVERSPGDLGLAVVDVVHKNDGAIVVHCNSID
jgi:hypothetical protein